MDTNSYLSRKSEVLFEFLNRDKNGLLTHEQLMLFPKKMAAIGQHCVAQKIEKIYTVFFNKLCAAVDKTITNDTNLTRAEFVKANDSLRSTDWFRNDFMESVSDLYFDTVDYNNDDKISLDEWRKMYQARGIDDENFIQSTFAKMDVNGDGVIQRTEFKRAFIQFGVGVNQKEDFSFLYDTRRSN